MNLRLDRWATGGTCIAHAGGETWFVRYGLPGELVRATVTRRSRGVVYADAIEVLEAAPSRVVPPCPHFGPGQCGGCDLQHASLAAQRESKREVVIDCLTRLGGVDAARAHALTEATMSIPGSADGLRWRTRMTATRTPGGIGMHRLRSHDRVDVSDCAITRHDIIREACARVAVGSSFRAAEGDDGRVAIGPSARVRETVVTSAGERRWDIPVETFWQVHRGFAQVLGDAVLELAGDVRGSTWWDLYAGVGLLAAFLDGAGAAGVDAVESDEGAVRAARRALHDRPGIRLHAMDVSDWLVSPHASPDGVVVDPPRRGCDRAVIDAMGTHAVSRLVYVSCDPASLGRDTGLLERSGLRLARVLPIDAFPMTHHVETVALFTRTDQIS